MRPTLIAVLALLVAAPAAMADTTIYAGPPNQFLNPEPEIDGGELVTFTNLDSVPHDVTATGKGPDGKPLFASETIGAGQSSAVGGVEKLGKGGYPFICSVHPFMTGTIHVAGNGAPPPSSSPPPQTGQEDTKAPTVSLKVMDKKLKPVSKHGYLRIEVGTDEPSQVGVTVKSGKTVVASGSSVFSQAARTIVKFKLTKAGKKLVKKGKTLKLSVTAQFGDNHGNTGSTTAKGTLKR